MNNDAAFITEVWAIVKSYVPADDVTDTLYSLIQVFDEYGMADNLLAETALNHKIKTVAKIYFNDEDEDTDDDSNGSDDYE